MGVDSRFAYTNYFSRCKQTRIQSLKQIFQIHKSYVFNYRAANLLRRQFFCPGVKVDSNKNHEKLRVLGL